MRILLVEDDRALGEGIRTALKPEGYTVDWLQDGASALHALSHESFELAILDLGLPRLDGLEVLKRLRAAATQCRCWCSPHAMPPATALPAWMPVPTIIWSSRSDVAELKARLRALLRRSFNRPEPSLEYRGILLDPVNQQVSYQGTPINLPRKEFVLLHELIAQPGRVLTRDRLQQVLYGWDEEVESNALEVHIHHLRKKFFPELIRTVRGVGYLVDKC